MIRTTLLAAILSLLFLPVFSQGNSPLKLNNTVEGVSVYTNRNPFYAPKAFDFSSLMNDSLNHNKIFIPRIPDIHLCLGQLPAGKMNTYQLTRNIDNMPVLKPVEVYAPMKIYEPDPRERYTLLITD
ncbi:MAG: hypothetical protein PHT07_21260 [Paludibacter sp.]|nr:hypothetical protein [Paludibacter sp.]